VKRRTSDCHCVFDPAYPRALRGGRRGPPCL